MKILQIDKEKKLSYRIKLWNYLNCKLTEFENEIFYIMINNIWEEIWLRRVVYNLDEKYFSEYGLEKYRWKKIWFFTWTFIDKNYRNNWYWTKMFNIWLEKFKELKQDYVFSDARDTSLNIFLKNWFEKIWEIITKEWIKETIVIKKLN